MAITIGLTRIKITVNFIEMKRNNVEIFCCKHIMRLFEFLLAFLLLSEKTFSFEN